jgi:hypothetical protein
MRYTIRDGVEHRFSSKFANNYKLLIPLFALLIFVVLISPWHSAVKKSPGPRTLGIYTIKSTSDNPSPSNNNPSTGGSSSPTATPTLSPPLSQSAPLAASASPSLQGGMGGGVPSGGDVQSGGSVPTSTVPTTFPCVDITSGLAFTCTEQACTPPVTLIGSQKAWLTTTGSCVVVN